MELLTNQAQEEINKLLHEATETQVKNLYYFFQSFVEPVEMGHKTKQEYINKIYEIVNNLDWQLMEKIYIVIEKLEDERKKVN